MVGSFILINNRDFYYGNESFVDTSIFLSSIISIILAVIGIFIEKKGGRFFNVILAIFVIILALIPLWVLGLGHMTFGGVL